MRHLFIHLRNFRGNLNIKNIIYFTLFPSFKCHIFTQNLTTSFQHDLQLSGTSIHSHHPVRPISTSVNFISTSVLWSVPSNHTSTFSICCNVTNVELLSLSHFNSLSYVNSYDFVFPHPRHRSDFSFPFAVTP